MGNCKKRTVHGIACSSAIQFWTMGGIPSNHRPGADPGLVVGGAPTPLWGAPIQYIYTFSEKPHEIKEILVGRWGGGAPGVLTPKSATADRGYLHPVFAEGGVPHPVLDRIYPVQEWMGVPPPPSGPMDLL